MSLQFPNPARSYNPDTRQVQFWGYAQAVEFTFYLNVATLQKLHPDVSADPDSILAAFDASIDSIRKAANEVYSRGSSRQYSYTLPASAF